MEEESVRRIENSMTFVFSHEIHWVKTEWDDGAE